jgi:hypothetical protein
MVVWNKSMEYIQLDDDDDEEEEDDTPKPIKS